ncbi:uncharacterized protein LOC133883696 isoform X2 [Phragmites australis]|uniref:uncharacterized protein LOC133883696 isoform X2 n=2 Tax=Phragmites australis TaxID=29695 RepID=UPI002D76BF78|nr:uncharacterized protein LOC133883696 isoform X2 [Phragmites australis]
MRFSISPVTPLPFPLPVTFPYLSPSLFLPTSPDHRPDRDASTDAAYRPTASPPPIVPRFVEQRTMEGSFQLNPDASPFIPASLSSFADKTPEKQAESSSKGDPSGGTSDLSQYEENDLDPFALAKLVLSMFPDVSTDFIDELLKANEFDMNLTIDMLHELNSQDMLHDDDAELGLLPSPDINDLHDGLGQPGTEVSETSSDLNQAPQNEKSATTCDVNSVLPTFPKTNLLHNDLGLPDDDKPEGTSVAN